MGVLEDQLEEWRAYVSGVETVDDESLDELEAHLRDQIAELLDRGLAEDEAFLVAVKRMGSVDALSREFAREHSERLWKQLVLAPGATSERATGRLKEALALAVLSAIAIQVLVRSSLLLEASRAEMVIARNASLVVLPFLCWYFARDRGLTTRQWAVAATPFAIAALALNLYPWGPGSSTEIQAALHVPVAIWFGVAYAYVGGDWRSHERRMDFVRFTGEWFIYYVLIALGGGVLMALTALILEPLGSDVSQWVFDWVLPAGAAGAVIVSAWLVEAKQSVVENMAPVLTKVFTPLFAVMLLASAVTYLVAGLGAAFNRELLAVFDALLVVVVGLVLYSFSARDRLEPPGIMDRIQLVAVVSALALDGTVLASMLARITQLGFTPNRVVALGLNLVLLGNLVWAAWLSARFLRGGLAFHRLERWQTSYMPVYAFWASAVVLAVPLLFGFG